jgi:hypothetical protein
VADLGRRGDAKVIYDINDTFVPPNQVFYRLSLCRRRRRPGEGNDA